jgi:hypothetical protein
MMIGTTLGHYHIVEKIGGIGATFTLPHLLRHGSLSVTIPWDTLGTLALNGAQTLATTANKR